MVILSERARSLMKSLDSETRKMIGAEIRKFQDGAVVDIKKLKGEKNIWRIAAGDWRVLLEVTPGDDEKVFQITDIALRRDAYRK